MIDNSMAGGLASGLMGFTDSYIKTRSMLANEKRNQQYADIAKQNEQAGLLGKGMQVGDTGNVEYTPEMQEQRQAQMEQTNMSLDPESSRSKARYAQLKERIKDVKPHLADYIPEGESEQYYNNVWEKPVSAWEGQSNKINVEQTKNTGRMDLQGLKNKGKIPKGPGLVGSGTADPKTQKELVDFSKQLDPNGPRSGEFGKSQAMLNASKRVSALIDQFPDGNIPKSQTTEIATAVAALVGGGSVQSQHQLNEIVPHSLKGNAEDIASWFTDEPTGRQQQKFIKLLSETAKREGGLAADNIRSVQTKRLGAYSGLYKRAPQDYLQIVKQHIGLNPEDLDERGQYKGKSESKGLLTSGAKPDANGFVKIKDPQGNIRNIKSNQVQDALSAGGKLVE